MSVPSQSFYLINALKLPFYGDIFFLAMLNKYTGAMFCFRIIEEVIMCER